ncbi:MAPEG family protein [Pseudomonadales bacterium]|nr:MAPEG family protein [Pseudomonadales bacterium]
MTRRYERIHLHRHRDGIITARLLLHFVPIRHGPGRFGVQAPSHDGPEDYQRYVRAHLNTLEHLVLFVPSLWLFALAVDPFWAAGIGVFWPIGRLLYALGYYQAPSKRMLGLMMSMPPIYIFVLGSLIGFCLDLYNGKT